MSQSQVQTLLSEKAGVGLEDGTQQQVEVAVVQDNRAKAIFCMLVGGIGMLGNAIFFKMAAEKGARVYDYQVFRNLSLLLFSSIQMAC